MEQNFTGKEAHFARAINGENLIAQILNLSMDCPIVHNNNDINKFSEIDLYCLSGVTKTVAVEVKDRRSIPYDKYKDDYLYEKKKDDAFKRLHPDADLYLYANIWKDKVSFAQVPKQIEWETSNMYKSNDYDGHRIPKQVTYFSEKHLFKLFDLEEVKKIIEK